MAEYDDDWILFRLQRLKPTRFEELCLALLKAKGHRDVRHLGAAGSESGVDLLSTDHRGSASVRPQEARLSRIKTSAEIPNPSCNRRIIGSVSREPG